MPEGFHKPHNDLFPACNLDEYRMLTIEQQLRICLRTGWRRCIGDDVARISRMLRSTASNRLRRAPHVLDWANMPDPFRHYEGVPVLDLPADPPVPETPALDVLHGASGTTPAADGPTFLSQLLFYSAAISASKRVPSTGYRYALRVNPSSGNLHPTEFHFLTRGLKEWPDGLYHYRPSAHMAEQRALGDLEMKLAGSSAPIVFVLTSIAWREAWKYRDRAYRYCLHDIGHAWQALALAARAIGCDSFAIGHFPDDEVAQFCRLHEDEWPMLIVELRGRSIPVREPDAAARPFGTAGTRTSSREKDVAYPRIDGDSQRHETQQPARAAASPPPSRPPLAPARSSCLLQLHRGAPLARSPGCGVRHSTSWVECNRCRWRSSRPSSLSRPGRFPLILPVHVSSSSICTLIASMGCNPACTGSGRSVPSWSRSRAATSAFAAAGLSLGQDLAGNACVAFSMIGDLDRAARAHGDRGYRYVHFEAGAIGHRLYLAAEALGLGATGIGAFYDDEVHRYLNLAPEQGQVVYHFAIGYPVPDPRLRGMRSPWSVFWCMATIISSCAVHCRTETLHSHSFDTGP